MASPGLRVEFRSAWWLRFYLRGVLFMALTLDLEPDWEKVFRMVLRAMRFRFGGARRWQRL